MKRWIAFALVAAVAVGGFALSRRGTDAPGASSETPGRLGPTPGPDAEGHIRTQKAYLARIVRESPDEAAAALVSVARLLRVEDAARLASGTTISAVFMVYPDSSPEIVAVEASAVAEVNARARDLAGIKEAEAKGLEDLAARSPRAERPALVSDAAVKRDAARRLRAGCPCVYAFVVEQTTVRRLGELGSRPEIRLVDTPDPLVDDLSGWELTPVMPKGT